MKVTCVQVTKQGREFKVLVKTVFVLTVKPWAI